MASCSWGEPPDEWESETSESDVNDFEPESEGKSLGLQKSRKMCFIIFFFGLA